MFLMFSYSSTDTLALFGNSTTNTNTNINTNNDNNNNDKNKLIWPGTSHSPSLLTYKWNSHLVETSEDEINSVSVQT